MSTEDRKWVVILYKTGGGINCNYFITQRLAQEWIRILRRKNAGNLIYLAQIVEN